MKKAGKNIFFVITCVAILIVPPFITFSLNRQIQLTNLAEKDGITWIFFLFTYMFGLYGAWAIQSLDKLIKRCKQI